MLHEISACLFFAGIGVVLILTGVYAIKNEYLANSVKSKAFTGVTHLEGKKAVSAGRGFVVFGGLAIFASFLSLLVVLAVSIGAENAEPESEGFLREARGARAPFHRQSPVAVTEPLQDFPNKPTASPKFGERTLARKDRHDSVRENQAQGVFGNLQDDSELAQNDDDEWPTENKNRVFGAKADSARGVFGNLSQAPIELGSPSEKLPPIFFDISKVSKSELIGFVFRIENLSSEVIGNRVLVGFVVSQGKAFRGAIQNVQPIFQADDEYILGTTFGEVGGDRTVLMAPSGHVVSALNLQSGVQVMSLQIVSSPLDSAGNLDLSLSEVGAKVGVDFGRRQSIEANGKAVVGIQVGVRNGDLKSLGIISADDLTVSAKRANGRPDKLIN